MQRIWRLKTSPIVFALNWIEYIEALLLRLRKSILIHIIYYFNGEPFSRLLLKTENIIRCAYIEASRLKLKLRLYSALNNGKGAMLYHNATSLANTAFFATNNNKKEFHPIYNVWMWAHVRLKFIPMIDMIYEYYIILADFLFGLQL